MMDLKTHTAYPEILITEAFDWMLADKNGRVDDPKKAPKDSEVTVVYLWGAKIIGQPTEAFDDFIDNGGEPEDFVAPVPEEATGEADSRKKAITDAVVWVESVADEYLWPVEEETAE